MIYLKNPFMSKQVLFGSILFLGLSSRLLAHNNHEHKPSTPTSPSSPSTSDQPAGDNAQVEKIDQIAALYQRDVEPLLRRACGDCHSKRPQFPWYYSVPGVRSLIDSDIAEAREHLDISEGFPFISHSSPVGDLQAIAKSIKDGSMPPTRYTLMHSAAVLTEPEKELLIKWADKSVALLKTSDAP